MTNKTDFSLDVTLSQPMQHQPVEDLVAFDDCKAYPLPGRKMLLRNPQSGQAAVIMPEVLSALGLCREFHSLDEHAARVEQGLPQLRGQADEIRRVLDSMLQQGMMVSASKLAQGLSAPAPAAGSDGASAVVVILTWERPEALGRLLGSIAENGDRAAIESLYVVDDSRSEDHIARNEQAVAAFAERSEIAIHYFGRVQQQALLARIVARVPEFEAELRFLADGTQWASYWTSGLARNFALLLSVGKRLVMLDDDSLFEVYEPGQQKPGISLASSLREGDFFEQVGEWPTVRRVDGTDPVRAHLRCLGLPLGAAINELGVTRLTPESLAGTTPAEVRRLRPESPVLVTQCGTVGDPGTGANTWLIELEGDSRERMLQSPATVDAAIRNHSAWVGRSRPHVLGRANMSLITGADNRHPLPPYFPALRGEDRLFGSMVRMLFPDSAVLDGAWAAPHLPLEQRDRSARESGFAMRPGFPGFFKEWIQVGADRVGAETYEQRLEALAGLYAELGSLGDHELAELYRDEYSRTACSTMVELQDALGRAADAPDNWAEYLQEGVNQVDAGLREVFNGIPVRGTPRDLEGAALIELWRDHWTRFGAALRAWPAIREAAAAELG